jgi:hypothetical protein
MNRRELCSWNILGLALLAASPMWGTETYTTAAATSISSLGVPNVAYAQSGPVVYASFGSAFGAAATTSLTQLATTATTVTYASSSTTDSFAAFGAAFGAPVGAAASSSPAGPIQSYAAAASSSSVNGYSPNVISYAVFGAAYGAPVYAITQTSSVPTTFSSGFLSANPEPSTWMMFATAIVALVFVRRRAQA